MTATPLMDRTPIGVGATKAAIASEGERRPVSVSKVEDGKAVAGSKETKTGRGRGRAGASEREASLVTGAVTASVNGGPQRAAADDDIGPRQIRRCWQWGTDASQLPAPPQSHHHSCDRHTAVEGVSGPVSRDFHRRVCVAGRRPFRATRIARVYLSPANRKGACNLPANPVAPVDRAPLDSRDRVRAHRATVDARHTLAQEPSTAALCGHPGTQGPLPPADTYNSRCHATFVQRTCGKDGANECFDQTSSTGSHSPRDTLGKLRTSLINDLPPLPSRGSVPPRSPSCPTVWWARTF